MPDVAPFRLLMLTRYEKKGASSRYRFYAYLSRLMKEGIEVTVSPLLSDHYVTLIGHRSWRRYIYILCGYGSRLRQLCSAKQYDLLWIEKELFPYFPAWAERLLSWLSIPYMVDYDDAIFHLYDHHRHRWVRWLLGHKISSVIKHAASVTAGSHYLQRFANQFHHRVYRVPTVVDTDRYAAVSRSFTRHQLVWIGSPTGTHHIRSIYTDLCQFIETYHYTCVIIGADDSQILAHPQVRCVPWSEQTELTLLAESSIGIMPLEDSPFARGKCAFKLIQYMAMGLPVIASDVGENRHVFSHLDHGYLVQKKEDWQTALVWMHQQLAKNPTQFDRGNKAHVKAHYSTEAIYRSIRQVLCETLGSSGVT